GLGVVPCSIPLGLIAGRPFKPFSRAISSRCSATIRLRSATSPSSFTTSCSSSACDRPDSSGGVVTSRLNRVVPCRRNHFLRHRPRFCPSYTGGALSAGCIGSVGRHLGLRGEAGG